MHALDLHEYAQRESRHCITGESPFSRLLAYSNRVFYRKLNNTDAATSSPSEVTRLKVKKNGKQSKGASSTGLTLSDTSTKNTVTTLISQSLVSLNTSSYPKTNLNRNLFG